MNDFEIALIAVFFAVAPVVGSITVRDSIKQHRQQIILDLTKFFRVKRAIVAEGGVQAPESGSRDNDLLHSFEFVKFKYFLEARPEAERPTVAEDFRQDQWALLALPLIILLMGGNIVAISIINVGLHLCGENSLPKCLMLFLKGHHVYRLSLLGAYAGAYAYMIRAFFQAVNNFDLTPASFIGAFNNILFGVILPQVALFATFAENATNTLGIGAVVLTSFVGGYMPDAILRYVFSWSIIKYFKEEKFNYGDQGKSTPIEILDGIDSLIRYKLSDFHVTTVQNLACANPIMLFVETPYGIYQMLDWVAQAQLCASVGADSLFKLWRLGIRTIFDLERIALHEKFMNNELLRHVEEVLFPDIKREINSSEWRPDFIVASIKTRVDGSYTQRLRQIVNCVADQLGGVESRLLRD